MSPRAVTVLAFAVGLGFFYALGALLPFWFVTEPEAGVAFFPPAGLTVAALIFSPMRRWPLLLAAVAIAEITVDLTHDQTWPMALGFALANTAEPLVGAWTLRQYERGKTLTFRGSLVSYIVCCLLLGPVLGGVIGATTAVLFGDAMGWASIASRWWLGDALGVLVVATPVLAWSPHARIRTKPPILGTVAIAGVATAIAIVPALLWHHPLVWAVLPVLIGAALWGGTRAVSITGVGVGFAAAWAAVTGRAAELIPGGTEEQQLVLVQSFLGVTLLASMVLAAEVADRQLAEQVLRFTEADRTRAELLAAESERRRIGRETHDIVGHALNVLLLQTAAARRALDADIATTREFLESIESTGRDAFRDLDVALGLVDRSPDLLSGRGLSQVPELIEQMRNAGLDVGLEVDGPAPEISTLVDWSAYRIIQEALTNVAKHAPGATAQVTIVYDSDAISVSVIDNGRLRRTNGSQRAGRGVIGMHERALVLGGEIEVGPRSTGGYAVQARLPLQGARP